MNQPNYPEWADPVCLYAIRNGVEVWQVPCPCSNCYTDSSFIVIKPRVELPERNSELKQGKIIIRILLEREDVLTLTDDASLSVAGQLINHIATITDQNPYELAKKAVEENLTAPFNRIFNKDGTRKSRQE